MSREPLPEIVDANRPFGPGALIGDKYRLERQLGEGAMGTVWLAHNELLDVDVAIKLMRTGLPRIDPSMMYERLLQEARAAARLGHPAIVRIFDFGRSLDGAPFIVMELLEGEPLSSLMEREPRIAPTRAVQMLLPIADALASAHDRGIVHRDVKPENIYLARDEYDRVHPKIVDFGVARFAEGGRTLTQSGALIGTPDYMAPEQAQGSAYIDQRADVWALCVVLYELIAGERPFGAYGTNYLAVLRSIVEEEPKTPTCLAAEDRGLWAILRRGLEKELSQRWDTMRVLGESLALWLYERGVKEDAYGSSIKTTWLQSGLDGVKIDTSSMAPPGDSPLGVSSQDLTLPPGSSGPPAEPDPSDAVVAPPSSVATVPARARTTLWLLLIAVAVTFVASTSALVLVLRSDRAAPALAPTGSVERGVAELVSAAQPTEETRAVPQPQVSPSTTQAGEAPDAGPKGDASATAEAAAVDAVGEDRPETPPIRRQRPSGSKSERPALPAPGSFDFGF